ncbi:MAG: elongation factor Ts [Candidatus Parcubacteria bacterium]|nr:MAG: elongation factor Ts [Candidatus Parcubacteria bacterium]
MNQEFLEKIKKLREETGAPIGKCREALEKENWDLDKAKIYLRKIGESLLEKKKEKETKNGIIEGYIHFNGRVGALVELLSETDFVAQNPEFKKLAHELAMQVAFMNPLYLDLESVSAEVLERKKQELSEDIQDKPEKVRQEIIEGRLKKWAEEICLLEQPYFKDENLKIRDLINEYANKFGEKIEVRRFARLSRDE